MDDFVFGGPLPLEGDILPSRRATPPSREDAAKLIALAEPIGDTLKETWDAVQQLVEQTRMPIPLIADQHGVSVEDIKTAIEHYGWRNPRKKAEAPVVDRKLDENGDPVKELTAKQTLFVEEYLKDLAPSKAAERAGLTKNTGAILMNKPEVREAVDTAIAERAARNAMTQDDVLLEIERLAKAKMTDYVKWDDTGKMTYIPSDRLTDDQKAGIISISNGRGGMKIELAKTAGIKMLAQHMGMLVEKVEADHRVAIIMTEVDIGL